MIGVENVSNDADSLVCANTLRRKGEDRLYFDHAIENLDRS